MQWLLTFIFSFLGTLIALAVAMVPLANLVSYKVYHRIVMRMRAEEDRFARRKQV